MSECPECNISHLKKYFVCRASRITWWRHEMETFSALLDLCAGNFPHRGQWRGAFFDLRLSKRLNKESRRRWFETPSRSLWRHCNESGIQVVIKVWIKAFSHWKINVIWTSLTVPEVVILRTCGSASDENIAKMMTFLFLNLKAVYGITVWLYKPICFVFCNACTYMVGQTAVNTHYVITTSHMAKTTYQ